MFECEVCGKKYKTKVWYDKHVESKHPELKRPKEEPVIQEDDSDPGNGKKNMMAIAWKVVVVSLVILFIVCSAIGLGM